MLELLSVPLSPCGCKWEGTRSKQNKTLLFKGDRMMCASRCRKRTGCQALCWFYVVARNEGWTEQSETHSISDQGSCD